MRARSYLIKFAVTLSGFSLFLILTRPSDLPVLVLFVPYVALGLMAYFLWMMCGYFIFKEGARIQHTRIAAYVFAAIVVICAGLSSLGEFTLRDFLVTLLLGIGTYFYATRTLLRK